MSDHAETVRNYYRSQGAQAELQRIIDILRSDLCELPDWKSGINDGSGHQYHPGMCYPTIEGLDRIIEIITGDKS
jgi:hypothetical protein